MPGYLTDYTNSAVMNHIFGGLVFEPPKILYVGLSQSEANRVGLVTEPQSISYERVAVPNNLLNFPRTYSTKKYNEHPIVFPMIFGEDWGLIKSVFIADALVAGNVLVICDLCNPVMILATRTSPVTIATGALYISHK